MYLARPADEAAKKPTIVIYQQRNLIFKGEFTCFRSDGWYLYPDGRWRRDWYDVLTNMYPVFGSKGQIQSLLNSVN